MFQKVKCLQKQNEVQMFPTKALKTTSTWMKKNLTDVFGELQINVLTLVMGNRWLVAAVTNTSTRSERTFHSLVRINTSF